MSIDRALYPAWAAEFLEYLAYWSDELSPFQLLLLALVTAFVLTAVFLVAYILVLMLLRNRNQRWADALQSRVEDAIAIWLSGEHSDAALVLILRSEIKKDKRAAEVIINVILATSKLFRGDGQQSLRELLNFLNLHQVCYTLLKSGRWYEQAYATRVISQLQLSLALPLLAEKLRTENTTLRLELITAMVALGDQSWLRGGAVTNNRLSDWEQILLLERFRRLDTQQLPPFDSWLASGHPDWILFGVRLCRHYNRFDKLQEMGILLEHPDRRIQMAVLDAMDYLTSPENIPFLTAYIQQATGDQLMTALKVLGNQGDPDVIDLLLTYAGHADQGVQLSALSALKSMGFSKNELMDMASDPRYIDHLFDPKLK